MRAPFDWRNFRTHRGFSLALREGDAYVIQRGRWLMRNQLLLLLLLAALLAPTWAYAGPPGIPTSGGSQSDPVRKGVGHFDKAFYDLTPHKRDLDASQEYDLAIAEFQRELAVRPSSAEAHAYLARIYYLRKQFDKAASHYDQLTALDPHNIDAYVLAALAYAEDGKIAEARTRLTAAKHQTIDPGVLARLDEYLAKLPASKP
jgi:tetratricopeptide (TPR) repeat protein